jgi:hypothetical protein
VEALDFRWSLEAQFGDKLRLVGYNNYVFDVLPGETVDVDLFWQALTEPSEDFLPRLQLIRPGDQIAAQSVQKPVAGTYPTAWWKSGELVRDPQSLLVTADVSPGYYTLALSLVRAADGQPVEIKGGQTWVGLGDISVASREHNYEPPSPEYVQLVQLGTSVELVGYKLWATRPTPSSTLDVRLYWHALETPDKNYHSFVHLLDANDTIVAQDDGVPGAATLGWLPGEYLADDLIIQIPSSVPAGTYRLGVGLYEPATGLRLGERILLDTAIQVTGHE